MLWIVGGMREEGQCGTSLGAWRGVKIAVGKRETVRQSQEARQTRGGVNSRGSDGP